MGGGERSQDDLAPLGGGGVFGGAHIGPHI